MAVKQLKKPATSKIDARKNQRTKSMSLCCMVRRDQNFFLQTNRLAHGSGGLKASMSSLLHERFGGNDVGQTRLIELRAKSQS